MRVTLVSPFDPNPREAAHAGAHVGGVERVYSELAQGLARRGHEVTLVCSSATTSGATVERSIRVVRARRRLTLLRTPLVRLARHIPSDADVVQVAGTYPFTTSPVLRAARAQKIPAILDFHFEPAPGTAIGRAAAAAYRHIGPHAHALADAVLVRSLEYARNAPGLARVPQDRWRVVPNGIDARRFFPDGAAGEGGYVLFVGRLVPYKGLDVLLEALAQRPIDLPLWIAGDGPLRNRLEARARELGVPAQFLGHVPDARLPDLYRGARVTVLPSVTSQEAFGMALLESMACGTPVVASGLPGVDAVARLGGRVSKPGDAQSLAHELGHAMETDCLPRGRPLADRIHRSYSWDAVTQRVVDVYQEVLARDPHRPTTGVSPAADPRHHPVL